MDLLALDGFDESVDVGVIAGDVALAKDTLDVGGGCIKDGVLISFFPERARRV